MENTNTPKKKNRRPKHYKHKTAMERADEKQKPYFRMTLMLDANGKLKIDSSMNAYFYNFLDELYKNSGRTDYKVSMSNEAKIAFYCADAFNHIADQYVEDDGANYDENPPPMQMGENPNITRVDIANKLREKGYDFERG